MENEAHFMLESLLHNLVRDKFPSLCVNVVLGSFKYFLSIDHQVDISVRLTKATAILSL